MVDIRIVDVTLSLDTSPYASGDVLADTQELAAIVEKPGGGSTALHSITVIDKDDQGQGFDLVFLKANVPLGAENGVPTITDLNAENVLGIVSIAGSDFVDLGGCRVATVKAVGLVLEVADGATSAWVAAISRGTGTYSAAGIVLRFGFI